MHLFKHYFDLEELFEKDHDGFKSQALTTILKLLVSDYSVKNNYVIVKLKDKYIKINSSATLWNGITSDFWGAYGITDDVYYNFLIKIKDEVRRGNLIEALNNFNKKYVVLGRKLENKKFYKLYYTSEPSEILYSNMGRSWIDYDEQLKNSNIIYDSKRDTVIWGMMPECKNRMINSQQARKHYGNALLTIKTLPKEKYVLFDEEIIGKKFKVIGKTQLS
ncbi:hypothetical protein CP356_06740 [Lactobacillus sp. UMNPBX5]|nr:hypothetical protein CP356_06740 [Lactobacillus sp. UMNPBX5]